MVSGFLSLVVEHFVNDWIEDRNHICVIDAFSSVIRRQSGIPNQLCSTTLSNDDPILPYKQSIVNDIIKDAADMGVGCLSGAHHNQVARE